MSAFREKNNGNWYVVFRYTNWMGERKQKCKRGFPTKRDALAWEREFLLQRQADPTMTFESFAELYERDMKQRLKENTWLTKLSIIQSKILPYFGQRRLCDITTQDIITWQNELLSNGYAPSYLKTVHNQCSAIFNHAVRHYGLKLNPASQAGAMGREEKKEMLFWTKEEYLRFIAALPRGSLAFFCFEMLYWCGVREGELLALTPADFDFSLGTVRISKSYQRLKKRDVITCPKTPKSNRTIQIPQFLCEELSRFLKDVPPEERAFPVSKHFLKSNMIYGCEKTGVRRIRIHDLRHSHVSLLIDMGFTALAIAERMGHESSEMTYRYAHLFPTRQVEMAVRLNLERNGEAPSRTPPAASPQQIPPPRCEEKQQNNIINLLLFLNNPKPRGGTTA